MASQKSFLLRSENTHIAHTSLLSSEFYLFVFVPCHSRGILCYFRNILNQYSPKNAQTDSELYAVHHSAWYGHTAFAEQWRRNTRDIIVSSIFSLLVLCVVISPLTGRAASEQECLSNNFQSFLWRHFGDHVENSESARCRTLRASVCACHRWL